MAIHEPEPATAPTASSEAPSGQSQGTSLADAALALADQLDGPTGSQATDPLPYVPFGASPGPRDVLAAANRAGLLTVAAQFGAAPAVGPDGQTRVRRAAVTVLVTDAVLRRRLTAAARSAGLTVTDYGFPAFSPRYGFGGSTVSLCNGEPEAEFGPRRDRSGLHYLLPGRHPDALREAARARQITLVDPEWGRNDRLWPLLARLAPPTGKAPRMHHQHRDDPRTTLVNYGASAHLNDDVLEELTDDVEDAVLDTVEQTLRLLAEPGTGLDLDQVLQALRSLRHQPQETTEPSAAPADRLDAYNRTAREAMALTATLGDFQAGLIRGIEPGISRTLFLQGLAVAAAAAPLEGTAFPLRGTTEAGR
ncbi:hypothetical protein ABT093_30635 [Kitasatospora sp. NPDC002551]|uniref:DUF6919 domain-containing protein n=1 Tax=Kitasatospora sp. NPDC002551 TaxID=3154539 RepID=UPI003332BDD7